MSAAAPWSDHLPEIRHKLRARIADLAVQLLGQPLPHAGSRRTLHFGRRQGSLHVELTGPKKGLWHDHALAEGGDGLALIQHVNGGTFPEAGSWAADWLGIDTSAGAVKPDPAVVEQRERDRQRKQAEAEASAAQDAAARAGAARAWWRRRTPLTGTAGAAYLASRGLVEPARGWPDCIGFLPADHVAVTERDGNRRQIRRIIPAAGAVVVAATDAAGAVSAIQRIYVDHDGQAVRYPNGQKVKLSLGPISASGAVVRLPGDAAGPLLLAEGAETGLSLWIATGHETQISLGSIANHRPCTGRRIVVARDDDAPQSPADKALGRALTAWRAAGADVVVATPWPERRADRSDFNDVLQVGGVAAVRARIATALAPGPADGPPRRLPIAAARSVLADAMGGFVQAAEAWDGPLQASIKAARANIKASGLQGGERRDAIEEAVRRARKHAGPAPVHAIRVDVGVGKSTEARRRIALMLQKMRAAGDDRTIVLLVPTTRLGDDQAALFEALPEVVGLTARVWRGRERPDPSAPGKTMCRDLDGVKLAQEAMQDVQTAVCQQKKDGVVIAECPHFATCGYQKQRNERADLWLAAHELLFLAKPQALGDIALVVVDESPWEAGLVGHEGRHIDLSLDSLQGNVRIHSSALASERLRFLHMRVADMADNLPDGPVPAVAAAALFDLEGAHEAVRLEWMSKVNVEMWPGMPEAERRAIAREAIGNKLITRRVMVWRAIAAVLGPGAPAESGWARLVTLDTENGPVRALRLKGRKPITEAWDCPTLLLDATLQLDLVRHYWPAAELTAEVLAAMPQQRIRQVSDRTYSKNHTADPSHMRDIHAVLCREARRMNGSHGVLAVLQAGAEADLHRLGNLPPGLVTAHHNAVRGRDGWRDVDGLIVVGRTAPPPVAVERLAEALSGAAVAAVKGWYPQVDAWREMADSPPRPAQSDRHPDPVAEAIRWSVTEGELLQILNRPRCADRTAVVDVLLMANTPLPIPVTEWVSAKDLSPSPCDMMMAAGGVVFRNATDAAEAYPDLWATPNAAKLAAARWRERLVSFPYNDSLYGNDTNLGRLAYQRAGAGKKPTAALVDLDLISDPERWLTDRIGALLNFSLVRPPEPIPEAPPASSMTAAPTVEPQPISSPAFTALALRHMALQNLADRLEAMRPPHHSEVLLDDQQGPDLVLTEVLGGYGDRPCILPGMVPSEIGIIGGIFRFPDQRTVLLFTDGARPVLQLARAAWA